MPYMVKIFEINEKKAGRPLKTYSCESIEDLVIWLEKLEKEALNRDYIYIQGLQNTSFYEQLPSRDPGRYIVVQGQETQEAFNLSFEQAKAKKKKDLPISKNAHSSDTIKFLSHPGLSMLMSLVFVAVAIAAPWAAPILGSIALAMGVLALAFAVPYAYGYFVKLKQKAEAEALSYVPLNDNINESPIVSSHSFAQILRAGLEKFKNWVHKHPVQAAIVGVGLALFITALVVTIGFFTGGAGFAFMAPVLATLGAPFAAACGGALGATGAAIFGSIALMLIPLNLANNFKRFAAWVDKDDDRKPIPTTRICLTEVYTPDENKTVIHVSRGTPSFSKDNSSDQNKTVVPGSVQGAAHTPSVFAITGNTSTKGSDSDEEERIEAGTNTQEYPDLNKGASTIT